MKLKCIIVTVAVMLAMSGCMPRNEVKNNTTNPNGVVPEVAESIREGANQVGDRIQEGISRLEEDFDVSDHERYPSDEVSDYDLNPEIELSGYESYPDNLDNHISEYENDINGEQSIAAAMSTDFSEIGALDNKMDNGFPGGPVDENNRPSGPMTYQKRYGKYDAYFIIPDSKKIYLTFDEGYENGYTKQILDVLKEKDVKAVFFITYPYAVSEKELVKRMIDEGHTIGNHSTAHKNFTTMPLTELAKDIMKLHNYVKTNYGYEMFLLRPPEGAFSEQTLALTQSLGYKTVLWSFAYQDWNVDNQPITIEAVDRIVSKAHPGEIALLHAVSKTNAEILGTVIDLLRDKGFVFADYFYFQ